MADSLGAIGPARHALPAPAPTGGGAKAPDRAFGEVLGEVAGDRVRDARPTLPAPSGPARGPTPPPPGGPPHGDGPPALRRVLVELVDGERRLDRVLRSALSGRDFSMQELIAIQATVLKHAQEVEAVSRLLDRLTGAVKTTLQTQV